MSVKRPTPEQAKQRLIEAAGQAAPWSEAMAKIARAARSEMKLSIAAALGAGVALGASKRLRRAAVEGLKLGLRLSRNR